ncbi:erythromycin esterase family protein [Flavobacterium sp. DSR2-3-3]|uniref:erythromycin esterase family protein n=1 Tax=Flavobacterium sp. DSR2-3-3 TaxID=2804632 RepID=UPI003CE9DE90
MGRFYAKIKTPQAINVSWEYAFNAANNNQNRFLLMNKIMRKNILFSTIDQRAIGVVYDTKHERFGNYFSSIFPERNDAFIFTNKTNELHSINIEFNENKKSKNYRFDM